jgi:lysine-N-methylase
MRSLLICLAGYYKDKFSTDIVVKAIQSCTKAIEHNPPYKAQIMRSFKENGMDNIGIIAVLLKI